MCFNWPPRKGVDLKHIQEAFIQRAVIVFFDFPSMNIFILPSLVPPMSSNSNNPNEKAEAEANSYFLIFLLKIIEEALARSMAALRKENNALKLEILEKIEESNARLRTAVGEDIAKLDAKFNSFENKQNSFDEKLNSFDEKLNSFDKKLNSFDKKLYAILGIALIPMIGLVIASTYFYIDFKFEMNNHIIRIIELSEKKSSLTRSAPLPPPDRAAGVLGDPSNRAAPPSSPAPPRRPVDGMRDSSN